MRGSGGSWLRGNRWQSETKEAKLRTTKITQKVTKQRDKAYNMQTCANSVGKRIQSCVRI